MYKKKEIGAKSRFLNMPHQVSVISAVGYTVKVDSYEERAIEKGLFTNSSIQFKISDCVRNIELEFDIQSKEDMRNSLHKLDAIISTCEELREDIKTARKLIRKGNKLLDELEKK